MSLAKQAPGIRSSWLPAVVAALLLAGCDDPEGASGLAAAAAERAAPGQSSAEAAPKADETTTPAASGGNASAASNEQRAAKFRAMAGRELDAAVSATPVEIAEVRRGLIESYYHGSTNLTAAEEAVVVARTRGVVEAIFVEEGDVVRAGERLAQLETERLELEAARSRTQLENLRTAYERAERLHEARMISPNEYDTAKFSFEAEQNNLKLREYELREAAIRATINGVITRRHIKVGHTLNQNAPAFEMKRLDSIEAILNVPEREIGRIHAGQYTRVLVDALPAERFEGRVSRVAPEVDPTTGTFRVTATLANEDGQLKPGMFSRVQVRVDQHPDALLTPLEAVIVMRERSSLFVVQDGIAERRTVTTGYVSDGRIEILSGAREGEQVVMTGQGGLRDGAPVRIVAGYSANVEG